MSKLANIQGQRFGRWLALYHIPKKGWYCQCDCGNTKILRSILLIAGNSRSCGCLRHELQQRPRKHPLVKPGDMFGRLTVLEIHTMPYGKTRPTWTRASATCSCSCGGSKTVRIEALQRGVTHSCGCINKEQMAALGKSFLKGDVPGQWNAFTQYQWNAQHRNHEFNLTLEEFTRLITETCYYCGAPPYRVYQGFRCNGLDRVDNARGYTLDNAVAACKTCNLAKRSMSHDDFITWVHRTYVHLTEMGRFIQ